MNPNDELALWRQRFIIVNLVRIGGTLVVLLGLAIWQTDWLSERGNPAIGLPLALIGLVISFFSPRWLARHWAKPPE